MGAGGLVESAAGLGLTLHRAFDLVPEVGEALDVAVALGFQRVLTSGGAVARPKGSARLRETFAQAAGRIAVMPGAGISAETVGALQGLPLREVHSLVLGTGGAAPLGFGAPRRTGAAGQGIEGCAAGFEWERL